jgi:signal transduction histidine kinase
MLGRRAAVLTHEFRNPLTTIFLRADILEDALRRLESSQRPQLLHLLRVMRQEVGRIEDLRQQYFWLVRRNKPSAMFYCLCSTMPSKRCRTEVFYAYAAGAWGINCVLR